MQPGAAVISGPKGINDDNGSIWKHSIGNKRGRETSTEQYSSTARQRRREKRQFRTTARQVSSNHPRHCFAPRMSWLTMIRT